MNLRLKEKNMQRERINLLCQQCYIEFIPPPLLSNSILTMFNYPIISSMYFHKQMSHVKLKVTNKIQI